VGTAVPALGNTFNPIRVFHFCMFTPFQPSFSPVSTLCPHPILTPHQPWSNPALGIDESDIPPDHPDITAFVKLNTAGQIDYICDTYDSGTVNARGLPPISHIAIDLAATTTCLCATAPVGRRRVVLYYTDWVVGC